MRLEERPIPQASALVLLPSSLIPQVSRRRPVVAILPCLTKVRPRAGRKITAETHGSGHGPGEGRPPHQAASARGPSGGTHETDRTGDELAGRAGRRLHGPTDRA